MALGLATQEAMYLRRFSSVFGIKPGSVVIFSDSQSAIELTKNPVNHTRSKHIDIKHHFVREKLASGIIELLYIATDDNVADCFTKALPKVKHETFLPRLLCC